jgi:hypothetical protein
MTRICGLLAACAGVATFAACSGNSNTAPASPTPSGTVAAITVTSSTPAAATFQLAATARLSDGSTRDVTAMATWSTSNPSVVSVSATGLATIVGAGSVELRAAYQNVTGALAMQFGPGFSLSGRVQEVGPNSAALSGVRIEIVNGPGAGTAVTSDADGAFRFGSSIVGVVDIEATKAGYVRWRLGTLTVDRNTSIDVAMYPTPPTNPSGATATARCHDGTWSWAQTVAEACTANGGILYGVCPGALCAATRSVGEIR